MSTPAKTGDAGPLMGSSRPHNGPCSDPQGPAKPLHIACNGAQGPATDPQLMARTAERTGSVREHPPADPGATGSSPVSPPHDRTFGPAAQERGSFRGRALRPSDESARFWSYVNMAGPTCSHRPELGPCWLWTGGQRGKGYGAFNAEKPGGRYRMVNAHRYAYELTAGVVPVGLVLDHLCENGMCVNPAHLEAVSNGENIRRGYAAKARRESEAA